MPKYSQSGRICFGVDSYVGIKEREQDPLIIRLNANQPAWLSEELICQCNAFTQSNGSSPYVGYAHTGGLIQQRGSNRLTAGSNVWANFNNPSLWINGAVRTGMGKQSVGFDGTIAYSPYQNNKDLYIEAPNTPIRSYPLMPVSSTACANKDLIVAFTISKTINFIWKGMHRIVVGDYTVAQGKGNCFIDRDTPYAVYNSGSTPGVIVLNFLTGISAVYYYNTDQHNPDCWSGTDGVYLTYSKRAGEKEADIVEVKIWDHVVVEPPINKPLVIDKIADCDDFSPKEKEYLVDLVRADM